MSNSKIYIPELWDNSRDKKIQVRVANMKIITSNKYKYFILHSISSDVNVFIVSCQLKHKHGYWVDITSSAVTNKGGLVTVDYYPDYRTQALNDTVVIAEKFYLSDDDKVDQNIGDIVLYIENGSSDLRDYHEYINLSNWIQVRVVYLIYQ